MFTKSDPSKAEMEILAAFERSLKVHKDDYDYLADN